MQVSEECWFEHEKLEVYRDAIAFIAWLSELLEGLVRPGDARDQKENALIKP